MSLPSRRIVAPVFRGPWERACLLALPFLAALVIACGGDSRESPTPTTPAEEPAPVVIQEPPAIRTAPLTGEVISEELYAAVTSRKPLAVMIDNIVQATPQAGLDQADVVIEALVEGGVTRYMAIFHSKEPEIIEPVRSARTPFLTWALEYDALYVHVGSAELDGPADAGAQIRQWGVRDMDLGTQPFDYSYIRNPDRKAPHNVLVRASEMRRKASQMGLDGPASFVAWQFSNPEGLRQGAPAPGFTVRFGAMSPRFSARWDWEQEALRYVRSQFGAPQLDAVSNNRLAFANVIVAYADAYVADANGHVLIDTIGEGRAQVFTNGQLIEGTWRKAELTHRTEFFGEDGQIIPLMTGPTWIEVVQPSGGAFLD